MTRKLIYFALLLGIMMSCKHDKDQGLDFKTEANVTFTLSLPEDGHLQNIRSAHYGANSSSAAGGLTNVNMANDYDLRYQLAIYRITDTNEVLEAVTPLTKVVDTYQPVSYSLRLTPNRKYKAVVWADYVRQGTTADLHYNTTDFKNIVYKDPANTAVLNDESRDAYFVSKDFVLNNDVVESLVLKRPFAKVRLVTTDWGLYDLERPDNFKVTYHGCKRFTGINALSGEATSSETLPSPSTIAYTGTIDKAQKEYALNYDLSEHNRTLVVDYLMTDPDEQTPIHMIFEALDGATSIAKHDLKTNIPIQRNWLTTIVGNALTTDASFTVSIDENFTNNWVVAEVWWNPATITPTAPHFDPTTNTYTITNRNEFAWLPNNVSELNNKKVVLTSDIDMAGEEWKPIHGATFDFDGQNHTLRNFSLNGKHSTIYNYSALGGFISYDVKAYTGVFGAYNGHMSNVTFENITINGRADDTVHTDDSGSPIKHDSYPAYFAGCIGYAGANWSTRLSFTNVHARHVEVKAALMEGYTQNIGGLIGWVGVGGASLENCSVKDINLICKGGFYDGDVGGFIGEVIGGRGITIRTCSADHVTIRTIGSPRKISGFIGHVKFGDHFVLDKNPIPTNVKYIDHLTGAPTNHKPITPYYGRVERNANKINIIQP